MLICWMFFCIRRDTSNKVAISAWLGVFRAVYTVICWVKLMYVLNQCTKLCIQFLVTDITEI